MFGLRWIVATSLCTHMTPTCPGLLSARRSGWRPTPVPFTYGHGFYRPCKRCQG